MTKPIGFRKATKKRAKLRLGIWGPPKAGKTMTSIKIGAALAKLCNTRMALIDTERESADFYADVADFDTDSSMETYAPSEYVARIKAAAEAGYGVLVIDSLSHAWTGPGGALEMKDVAAKKEAARTGGFENSYTAWRSVTPEHNKLVEAMLQYPGHVIATIRAKVDYEQVKGANGKTQVRKVGLAPVQREGLEYEFTMLAQVNEEHDLLVSGSRVSVVDGRVFPLAGEDFAREVLEWLDHGVEAPPAPPPPPKDEPTTDTTRKAIGAALDTLGIGKDERDDDVTSKRKRGEYVASLNDGHTPKTEAEAGHVLRLLKQRVEAKARAVAAEHADEAAAQQADAALNEALDADVGDRR
jgi:hypothetical protein